VAKVSSPLAAQHERGPTVRQEEDGCQQLVRKTKNGTWDGKQQGVAFRFRFQLLFLLVHSCWQRHKRVLQMVDVHGVVSSRHQIENWWPESKVMEGRGMRSTEYKQL
jgi:hypothetical protein